MGLDFPSTTFDLNIANWTNQSFDHDIPGSYCKIRENLPKFQSVGCSGLDCEPITSEAYFLYVLPGLLLGLLCHGPHFLTLV